MSSSSDIALIGTGVAPLVAASHLLSMGRSVLILNPDRDFFLEDSELPLDPLMLEQITPERLKSHRPYDTMSVIGPYFPGAIEHWPPRASEESQGAHGYYDAQAPHIRSRARLWMPMTQDLDDVYLDASEMGLAPKILEGIQARLKFPGMSQRPGAGSRERGSSRHFERGLLVSPLSDVDVSRYRNGLLEFIRERLGPNRVICNASLLEPMPGGIRFHADGAAQAARCRAGILVFWTPRLSSWILSQARHLDATVRAPKGARLWEKWSLLSRDPIDTGVVGIWDGRLAAWADGEGAPGTNELAVLLPGPLVPLDSLHAPQGGASWASAESFDVLASFCHDFLKWEKYTVRNLKARALFEWAESASEPWALRGKTENKRSAEGEVFIVPSCDGPLRDVVQAARNACGRIV